MTSTSCPAVPFVPLPAGRVEVTHFGHQALTAAVRGHTLVTDQPLEAGATASAPTPVALFVVSLATCIARYARGFLERHRLDVERLGVTAVFTMADDRPARVASVRLRVTVPPGLGEAELSALGAVVDHCTIHHTLRQSPQVTVEVDGTTVPSTVGAPPC
ncbi:OsmC family protein [Streptomyces sp. NPDC101234]|uniref:OsmC family protein n=1 Tax=Streptomyces sp. NPDC101234 TaxID=3366138 RepID=UPI003807EBD4